MDEHESLSHTKWDCKYHVVFIPKRRRKTLYGELRRHLGEVFRQLAGQKESRIVEGHLMPGHVHMMISIPPKYAVSQVVDTSGKECDPLGPDLRRAQAKLRRSALPGQGLLRLNHRAGRAGNPRVHQEPGTGGHAPGTAESVALNATFRWHFNPGPRQRPVQPL